jgi:hypothetical protein
MSKIIYKDEKITIKEISDRKIQVEKIVPVYVGEYLAEHIKMKIKFSKFVSFPNPDGNIEPYKRDNGIPRYPLSISLSAKYGTKLGNISHAELPMYSPIQNILLIGDFLHIQINDKDLERALKLKMVLE